MPVESVTATFLKAAALLGIGKFHRDLGNSDDPGKIRQNTTKYDTAPHTATPVVWVAVSIAPLAIANARACVQKTLRTATPHVWVAVLFFFVFLTRLPLLWG